MHELTAREAVTEKCAYPTVRYLLRMEHRAEVVRRKGTRELSLQALRLSM